MAEFTYDEPTNREDLTDVITNISPTQTPITTMIGKAKATATKHEWPEDELSDAAANAQIEGATDTTVPAPARTRNDNYTQIMKRGYSVTNTQQAVKTAGVSDEYGYNMLKAMKELAKDLELAVTTQTTKCAGTKTTARTFAGIPGMVTTNVLADTNTTPVPRFITRDLITTALQNAWAAGGEPNKLICSGSNKRIISALTTSNTKNIDAAKKQVIEAVDVIDTDFGRIEISASRFMPDTQVFVLDPQYIALAWLRPFKRKDLPDDSDGQAGVITGEMTLELRGEKGQAIIKDLKVS